MAEYRYKAFISYSHTDERWARWLHRALESYRVPKHVAAALELPTKRLRPIFRDRDELASAPDLSTTVQRALTESANLIVVCSQASSKSRWVQQEIEFFLREHGPAHVFCLIIDSWQDFSPALAGYEPMAADARTIGDGRKRALLKIIAGVLGVGFDELAQRDRQQRRRTTLFRGGLLTGAMSAAAAVTLWLGQPDPCPDPVERLTGVWDASSRSSLASAFADTDIPFAPDAAERVISLLDTYAVDWRTAHVSACADTRVTGSQSEVLLDKRMACLGERLYELQGLGNRLQQPDADAVQLASQAALALRPLAGCADTTVLGRSYPAPAADVAEEVDTLERQVADARAAFNIGQLGPARAILETTRAQVEQLDYPPLSAASLGQLAQIQSEDSDPAMAQTYAQALTAAGRSRNDAVVGEAWIAYVVALGETQGDIARAQDYLLPARVAVARLDEGDPLVASLANAQGAVAFRQGNLAAARNAMEQALRHAEQHESPQVSKYRMNLAAILSSLAEFDLARPMARQAFQDMLEIHGPTHPSTSEPLVTLGSIESGSGNMELALQYLQQALQIRRNAYGDVANEYVALAVRGVAWQLKEMGRLDAAREFFDEAIRIYSELPNPPPFQRAHLLNAVGDLEVYAGNVQRAERLLTEALDLWRAYPGNPGVANPLTNLGSLQARLDRHSEALANCTRALSLDIASLGDTHPNIAYSLTCMGEAEIGLGQLDEARGYLQRALTLRAHEATPEAAWTQFQLGRALWAVGLTEQALELVGESFTYFANNRSPDPWRADAVQGWWQQPDTR